MEKIEQKREIDTERKLTCIKSSASQACDICGSRAEEDKTKKKWIKTAQDQEEVDRWIKRFKTARPRSGYRCPGWGHRRSL